MKEIGLIDVWRHQYPCKKEFTFFSSAHMSHSRIDYFFMFGSDRHRVKDCEIGARDISDHSGVDLTVFLDSKPKKTFWRLNANHLNDLACKEYVKKELSEYLRHNDNGEVSPCTLWDASKAVMRGKFIMWASQKKKEKQKLLKNLNRQPKELETKYSRKNDPTIFKKIKEVRSQLNRIYDEQVQLKLKFIKQRYYENGPKAKKLIAWRIRKQQAERSIF